MVEAYGVFNDVTRTLVAIYSAGTVECYVNVTSAVISIFAKREALPCCDECAADIAST